MRNTIFLWSMTTLLLAGCAVEQPPAPQSVAANAATPDARAQVAPNRVAPSTPALSAAPQPAVGQKTHATGTQEDARRHMLRGMAAIEIAKSNDDLALAEDEFRMATEIAPQMAIAWFNLGKAQTQLGRHAEAMTSYRQYLTLAPDAKDAQTVRDEIVKLEFRQELTAKAQARIGLWVGQDGSFYHLTVNGNRLALKTNQRQVPENEVRSTYSLVGDVPVGGYTPAEYQLVLQGNRLTGTWSRGAVRADKCTIPPDTAEATGELNDREGRIVLHHESTSYQASTQMSLLGDDSCGGVVAGAKKTAEDTLYGPLGKGGLGVVLYGLTQWWDGGFSAIQFGWQGRLGVRLQPGTPAFEAGLRDEDEILAIDGVAVKSLSAGQAVVRLHGEPGSTVSLELWRKGNKDPFILTFRRIDLSAQQSGR
ncbi:MAG: PDZ domain-containing protein [Desulfurivibrionaceae bacterium]|jgi:hypothetical protein